jgi:hypothetical protein
VKESKAGALRRLLTLVNEQAPEKETKQVKAPHKQGALVESGRSVGDIKRIIYNLAETDKELGGLFKSSNENKDNTIISKFREETMNSLC